MRRGVHQDLVALIVEPHRRETDPVVRTDQTQSHSDRLIEQPFVLWIEITQARRLLALADCKLALLQAVSNATKIGYREAFRHRFLHRTRACAARDQYGRSKQRTKQYLDIVCCAYLFSIGNALSSGVDLSPKECCGWGEEIHRGSGSEVAGHVRSTPGKPTYRWSLTSSAQGQNRTSKVMQSTQNQVA